jgi:hypothetical protein
LIGNNGIAASRKRDRGRALSENINFDKYKWLVAEVHSCCYRTITGQLQPHWHQDFAVGAGAGCPAQSFIGAGQACAYGEINRAAVTLKKQAAHGWAAAMPCGPDAQPPHSAVSADFLKSRRGGLVSAIMQAHTESIRDSNLSVCPAPNLRGRSKKDFVSYQH